MAVFRNVMAFLGLDDDDHVYDDEAYYEDEEDFAESPPRKGKTIALEERLTGASETPSFGFSADTEMNEMGGVGAVRPLRPVPSPDPIPDSLIGASERRINQPDTAGAFEDASASRSSVSDVTEYADAQAASTDHGGAGLASVGYETPQNVEQPAPAAVETNGASPATRPSLTAIDGASAMAHRQSPVEEPQKNVVTHAKPRLHIPSSFDDASRIADDFRAGAPVVMNLSKVEKPVARRLVDFASGVCYALTGGMERVAPNVYLLTPVGIDVSPEDRRRMQERGFDR